MKAIIIDGNSLLYRVYYASINQLEYFKMHNIMPNNAIKLMIDLCFKLKARDDYKYGIIAFDCGKCTFRQEIVSEYKSNRKKMPPELLVQLEPVKLILTLMGYNVITKPNYEADDIIGSTAKIFSDNKINVDIYSSDKDMLQLINNYISVHIIKKGLQDIVLYNEENIVELIGLTPTQIIDYKTIVGDKSDNIIGIKGIGNKIGLELLHKYNSIENILKNINNLPNKIKDKFSQNIDLINKTMSIIKIHTDLYDHMKPSDFIFNTVKKDKILAFLSEHKINGMEKYL